MRHARRRGAPRPLPRRSFPFPPRPDRPAVVVEWKTLSPLNLSVLRDTMMRELRLSLARRLV